MPVRLLEETYRLAIPLVARHRYRNASGTNPRMTLIAMRATWARGASRVPQTRAAIPALLARFPALEPAGEPRWRRTLILRGLEELPVRLR